MKKRTFCPFCGAVYGRRETVCGYCRQEQGLSPEEETLRTFLGVMEQKMQAGKQRYQGRQAIACGLFLSVSGSSYWIFRSMGISGWSCALSTLGVFLFCLMSFGFYVEQSEMKGILDTYRREVGPQMTSFATERGMLLSELQVQAGQVLAADALLPKYMFREEKRP